MTVGLEQKEITIESEGSAAILAAALRPFVAFWATDSSSPRRRARRKEKSHERERRSARERKGTAGYARGGGIGLVFLLIKISNLTPECAVFNETTSGATGFLSLFSRKESQSRMDEEKESGSEGWKRRDESVTQTGGRVREKRERTRGGKTEAARRSRFPRDVRFYYEERCRRK